MRLLSCFVLFFSIGRSIVSPSQFVRQHQCSCSCKHTHTFSFTNDNSENKSVSFFLQIFVYFLFIFRRKKRDTMLTERLRDRKLERSSERKHYNLNCVKGFFFPFFFLSKPINSVKCPTFCHTTDKKTHAIFISTILIRFWFFPLYISSVRRIYTYMCTQCLLAFQNVAILQRFLHRTLKKKREKNDGM